MRITRVQNVDQLLLYWPFLVEGFTTGHTPADPEIMFRVVSHIVAHPDSGWIGVAEDFTGKRLGFVIMHENTTLYDTNRAFLIRFLHFLKEHRSVVHQLLKQFEVWARKQRINSYDITLNQSSGAATRFAKSLHRDFNVKTVFFERILT